MLPAGIRAIAWDIDGTLIDSEPLHHRALLAGSAHFGCDLADLDEDAFCGIHMHEVWRRLGPRLPEGLSMSDWIAAIERHYIANRHRLMPMPGALRAVERFAGRGLIQVCVSNSARAIVDANLDALGIAGRIAFSVSLDDVTEGKPAPEPYRMACERLGLPPAQVMAIEDSAPGLASARAAGLICAVYRRQGPRHIEREQAGRRRRTRP